MTIDLKPIREALEGIAVNGCNSFLNAREREMVAWSEKALAHLDAIENAAAVEKRDVCATENETSMGCEQSALATPSGNASTESSLMDAVVGALSNAQNRGGDRGRQAKEVIEAIAPYLSSSKQEPHRPVDKSLMDRASGKDGLLSVSAQLNGALKAVISNGSWNLLGSETMIRVTSAVNRYEEWRKHNSSPMEQESHQPVECTRFTEQLFAGLEFIGVKVELPPHCEGEVRLSNGIRHTQMRLPCKN